MQAEIGLGAFFFHRDASRSRVYFSVGSLPETARFAGRDPEALDSDRVGAHPPSIAIVSRCALYNIYIDVQYKKNRRSTTANRD